MFSNVASPSMFPVILSNPWTSVTIVIVTLSPALAYEALFVLVLFTVTFSILILFDNDTIVTVRTLLSPRLPAASVSAVYV